MKRIFLGALFTGVASSAMAADAAVDAPATVPGMSGYGEFYLGGINARTGGESDTRWSLGGAARLNTPFDERWNLQADATVDYFDAGSDGASATSYGGALHLYWRDPNAYAIGGFATLSEYRMDDAGDSTTWTVGPEAQVYIDNVTLYGQVYFGQTELVEDMDVAGLRGVVRYFAQPNLRFDAELGYRKTSWDGSLFDIDVETVSAALQANYRFDGSPMTVFGRYQYDDASMSVSGMGDDNTKSHKFVLGLRASFGTGTLLEEDRYGATMDTGRSNAMSF